MLIIAPVGSLKSSSNIDPSTPVANLRRAERSLREAAEAAAERGQAPACGEWTWLAARIRELSAMTGRAADLTEQIEVAA